MADDNLRVTATLVDHPPVVPAFAYRFDAADRSIVISGDTAPSQNLVKLAAGADVLVHSVMYPPALDRLVARVPKALKASILAHQTSAEDAGRVAQQADVRTLVLSHFVLADDPDVTDAMWREAASRTLSRHRDRRTRSPGSLRRGILVMRKLLMFVVGVGCLSPAGHGFATADEIYVLSAVGMRQVLVELAPMFERATGHRLHLVR